MMYFSVIWETVNSINGPCTCIFVPNHRITTLLMMYIDVLQWTIIPRVRTAKSLADFVITGDWLPHSYWSLVDSRRRDFIHCIRAPSL